MKAAPNFFLIRNWELGVRNFFEGISPAGGLCADCGFFLWGWGKVCRDWCFWDKMCYLCDESMAQGGSHTDFFVFRFSVAIAVILALLCTVADYWVNNMTYPIFDSSTKLAAISWLRRSSKEPSNTDVNLLMVNVAYDKAFVPVVDPLFGDTIGVRAITDRNKLLELMKRIEGADYRYLFVDVRFESGDDTPVDSDLFARFVVAPRLSISTHRATAGYDYEIADSALLACAGYSDYRHWKFDNFSHYELLQDGNASVALQMYREITGGDVSERPMWYTSNGRLCYNSIFLPLTSKHVPLDDAEDSGLSNYEDFDEVSFLNLGFDVLQMMTTEELRSLVRDKIVVVGDFDNDRHLTYAGEVSGPMLTYYAFKELSAGHHYVSASYMVALFMMYLVMALVILTRKPWYSAMFDRVGLKLKPVRYMLSLIGTSIVFTAAIIVFYMIWGVSLQVFVPAALLGVLSIVVSVKKYLEEIKDKINSNEKDYDVGSGVDSSCNVAQRKDVSNNEA